MTQPVATTTSASRTPDWQKLAEQVTEFLGALAATVAPSPEQEAVAKQFLLITGALGRPLASFEAQIDQANKSILHVSNAPEGADFFRVGDLTDPRSKLDEGKFDAKSNTITLKKVDPTKVSITLELYNSAKVLLARGQLKK